jgi:diadenosine tetraphosphate (Ap4A) HIT family hydrolase
MDASDLRGNKKESPVSASSPEACFTCAVARSEHTSGLVAYRSELVLVNHYHPAPGEAARTGWFIAAPVRHLCRSFELTADERRELTDVVCAFDAALCETLGSTRTLIASLGWFTLDHLHVHLVPTVTSPVTFGWEHFAGSRYTPLGADPESVTMLVGEAADRFLRLGGGLGPSHT